MEYQTRINETKKEAVAQLKEQLGQYSGFIFADYRGMTVAQITKMRKGLREKDAACRVVKNCYARLAFKELGHDNLDDQLVGPTAVVMAKEDQNAVAKVVLQAKTDSENKLSIRGGILDGMFMTAEEVEAFGKLPGRLELISSLMGTMKAPVQKLAATLLAYQEKLEAQGAN